jgi:hypothetical protein
MSQVARRSRVRLPGAMLSGRASDGHADGVTARLRKLAAAGSTGVLPVSGASDGAIYLLDGQVAFAESRRTPGPARAAAPGGPLPLSRIARLLAVTEPTVDAALDLLAGEPRCARFRPARARPGSLPGGVPPARLPVDALLTEVARRQRLLAQVAGVITADTAVARNPRLACSAVRVSAAQWALLIRVGPGSTPRALAWELDRSVFSTTADMYRLLILRLLSAGGDSPARGPAGLSFVRASSDRNGDQSDRNGDQWGHR